MEKNKIGLIQIDGKMPNLALMKLASWHRKKGDDVYFIDLSSLGIKKWYGSKIFMGGSGYDIKEKLPEEIEAQVPDYNLFNTDYSIGFTSRGCIRDCDFCIVKEKEGNLMECDFSKDIKHSKYIVMDNNFLASPRWKEKLKYFIDNDIKVNFCQGLDIRLINKENAKLLKKVKAYNHTFTYRVMHFAWDNLKDEKFIRKGIKILLEAGISKNILQFYMICGFNTTFDQDMYRYKVLWEELKVHPFVMLYHKRDTKLTRFSRWVNRRIHKTYSFESWLDTFKTREVNQND